MGKRPARVGRVMQNPRRINDIEGAVAQPRSVQVGFHELHAVHAEAPRRGGAQLQRGAGKIGVAPDHQSVAARQVQAHLPGAAAHFQDARIRGDRGIQQPRECAALSPHPQGFQAVARPVARKRRVPVEGTDSIGAGIAGHPEIGNAVLARMARAAIPAGPFAVQCSLAGRTSEQIQQLRHVQKME